MPAPVDTLPDDDEIERPAALVGATLAGKYAIDKVLGQGAMGTVYRARQLALQKTVAVKVLHPTLSSDRTFAQRFTREALAASRLDHPGIVRVLDFGQEPNGTLYLVMEHLEGAQLFDLIESEMPREKIVDLLAQILSALGAAHDAGVVHRDVKPENVMIVPGPPDESGKPTDQLKLLDFGIAVLAGRDGAGKKLTTAGMVMGTPEYMAPEQARGEPTDARSDLYSVGVIMYQLLTGELPFTAETPIGVALRHVTDPVRPPSTVKPGVDPHLEAVCLRALSKKPEDRYASAREFRAALRAALEGKSPTLLPHTLSPPRPIDTPAATPAAPKRVRSPAVMATIAACALVGAFAIGQTCARPKRPVGVAEGAASTVREATIASVPEANDVATTASTAAAEPSESTAPSASAPTTPKPLVVAARPVAPPKDDAVAKMYDEAAAATSTATITAPPPSSNPPPASTSVVPKQNAPFPPPPAALDASKAHVFILNVAVTNGVPPSSVRKILDAGAFTRCYRSAMSGANAKKLEATATLKILTDDDGRVTTASVGAPIPGAISACIGATLSGARIANVDTGAAEADVSLRFSFDP